MESREDLLNLIKSPEELLSVDGKTPGIYKENLLKVIGNKVGKSFKNLNGKFYTIDEKVTLNTEEIASIKEILNTIEENHQADIDAINTRIDDFQAELGSVDDFNSSLNS